MKEQIGGPSGSWWSATQRPTDYKPNIYANAPAPAPQVNLINVQIPEAWSNSAPQFLYLWAPGH